MKLITDESGQAGGIAMFVLGVLVIGLLYVAFGTMMNQINVVTNDEISGSLPHSNSWKLGMDFVLKFWWGFPIIAMIVFIVYGIKNALTKDPGEV